MAKHARHRGILAALASTALTVHATGGQIYFNNFDHAASWNSPSPGGGTVLAPAVTGGFLHPPSQQPISVSSTLAGVGAISSTGSFGGMMLGTAGLIYPHSYLNSLRLENLPTHNTVSIGFLLAVIDRWIVDYTSLDIRVGDGVTSALVFSGNFDNRSLYPTLGYTLNRMAHGSDLNQGMFFEDAAYDMSLESALQNIPHTSSTLTVGFSLSMPPGFVPPSHIGYGIDNLSITIDNPQVIPLPSAAGMALAGLGLLAVRRRR